MSEEKWNAVRAARHCGYVDDAGVVNVDAFRKWVERAGVKKYHVGRRLRFQRSDLDAAMDGRDVFTERALAFAAEGKR